MIGLVQKFLIPSILTVALLGDEPAHAQGASKSFTFTTPDNVKINVPCDDMSSHREFLENLDSRVHGFNQNIYALSTEKREEALGKKLGFMEGRMRETVLENMHRPYQRYNKISSEQEKINWLERKLGTMHSLTSKQINQLQETCEIVNPAP